MKRSLIILVILLFVGGMVVLWPYSRDDKNIQQINEENKKQMQDISSTLKTIKIPEVLDHKREPEQYDKEQMYFENIESLYKYFNFEQLEDIKERVQNYIHKNISKEILDCIIKPDTIKESSGLITVELTMEGIRYFQVQVTKDKDGRISDLTIINSILK